MQLREEIAEHVESELRVGVRSLAEVAEATQSFFSDEEGYPGHGVVVELVEAVSARLFEEQEQWSRPTDVEKLAAAFARLDAEGILARHHYAPTRTWGLGDLEQEIAGVEAQGRAVVGYVFYTDQDTEAAQEGPLHLAYGAHNAPRTTFAQCAQARQRVGQTIKQCLEAEGLNVVWDGDHHSTLEVDVDWRNPRTAETGRGVLQNPSVSVADASPRTSSPPPELPWPTTKDDEWWITVALVALDLSDAADLGLECVTEQLAAATLPRPAPGAVDFLLGGASIAGMPIRIDLNVAPDRLLFSRDRMNHLRAADAIVAFLGDADFDCSDLVEVVLERRERGRPVAVVLGVDSALEHVARALAESNGWSLLTFDFEDFEQRVMPVFQSAVKMALHEFRARLAAGTGD